MTTYCGERYVRLQLESLLSQQRRPDEVIICDDCSKDATADIVRQFIKENQLENWHFEVNKQNKGFIKNFADAISLTTGNIIFLCDQDDVWHQDKLSRMEKLFDSHPEAMAINGSFRFVDGTGAPISVDDKPGTSNHGLIFRQIAAGVSEKISLLEIVKENISPGCTMAFRDTLRDVYLKNTLNSMPHDFELNILAAYYKGLYFCNEELIDYRIHSANTIGLDTDASRNQMRFQSGLEKRLEVLRGQKSVGEYLRRYIVTDDPEINQYIEYYCAYIKLREKCLTQRNPFVWLKMLRYYNVIKTNAIKRQYMGDLLYALRVEKLFER